MFPPMVERMGKVREESNVWALWSPPYKMNPLHYNFRQVFLSSHKGLTILTS